MAATQFFEAAEKAIPDLKTQISKGEFKQLREWLRTNVHAKGSLYGSPDELLENVTGKKLDPNIFVNYLKYKYHKLYDL
jgi:carboxypeptidase Taq